MERCGIILAAGEGRRLQRFIHRLRGDALPKQYVNFFGERSLLEQTISRAETRIPADRLYIVVGCHHLKFREAARQLAGRPPGTVIAQPGNKETGPGILLPLTHLVVRHPESVVAIFPSDHFIVDEELFMGYVDLAFRAVELNPHRLILLGVEPHAPEADYGYILPERRAEGMGASSLKRVVHFVEKPQPAEAEELIQYGALWNTFVIVVRPKGLLELVRRIMPALSDAFGRIREAIGTTREQAVVDDVYRDLAPVNFSRELLERIEPHDPLQVSVLQARGVWWSDWGSERRLVAGLEQAVATGSTDRRRASRPVAAGAVDIVAEQTV